MLEFFVEKASYLAFTVFLALTGLGLPIPEEAPLVLAGVLSANGTLEHPWLAYLACLLGALLGDTIMYAMGRKLGRGYLMSHPRIAKLINAKQEAKFESLVSQHGFKVLLLTRFLILVRGPVYFAAGAARVPYLRFLVWDLCAATMVVSVVFGLAYRYGDWIAKWIHRGEIWFTVIVVTTVIIAGTILYKKNKQRIYAALERLAEEDEGDDAQPPSESPSNENDDEREEISA